MKEYLVFILCLFMSACSIQQPRELLVPNEPQDKQEEIIEDNQQEIIKPDNEPVIEVTPKEEEETIEEPVEYNPPIEYLYFQEDHGIMYNNGEPISYSHKNLVIDWLLKLNAAPTDKYDDRFNFDNYEISVVNNEEYGLYFVDDSLKYGDMEMKLIRYNNLQEISLLVFNLTEQVYEINKTYRIGDAWTSAFLEMVIGEEYVVDYTNIPEDAYLSNQYQASNWAIVEMDLPFLEVNGKGYPN